MTVRLRSSFVALACAGLAMMTAACGSSTSTTTPTPTAACSFSVVQPTTTFGADGGTGSVAVTTTAGCTWTATSSAGFLTISQGSSVSGNGTVTFAVAANTGADRTATLTVAGTSITITQRAPAATGTLSAPTAKSPIGGAAVDPGTPTLIVNNATATGTVGTVTYRFEVSDQPTFPADPVRTFTQDGVAQGSGTTGWVVNHNLGAPVLWYWHARATNGTSTTAYSATETFTTVNPCALVVQPTTASVSGSGGTVTITVTGGSTCAWTATSNSSFITVTSGASGTGNGTVIATVAAGSARSGTLTVAGQTVTITQSAASGIAASFLMTDPALSTNPTTACSITSGIASICAFQSTSFPLAANGLVNFTWTAQWTDGTPLTRTQDGANTQFSFTWTCGGPDSTTDGVAKPLAVTLTVTDSTGATATVTSGTGSQPPLFIRLFKC